MPTTGISCGKREAIKDSGVRELALLNLRR